MTNHAEVKLPALDKSDPTLADMIRREADRQEAELQMIASENVTSRAVMEAMGSCLTNKYAEGYAGKRYYAGCEVIDEVETLAIERLKRIFECAHANVQPHSGASANLAVYFAFCSPGDTVVGMNLAHGGHLTHGSPVNFSGKHYKIAAYGVDPESGLIDYDAMEKVVKEARPKMIVTGASAYPRRIDFKRVAHIAHEVGAIHMSDIAHYAGLIAAGLYPSPIHHADVVTTTTHKTLRGPRGGVIMCKAEHAAKIDKAVFPGIQGGPLEHVIAAKAACFGEALTEEFKAYQKQVLANAQELAAELMGRGYRLVSGGTDCHLLLLDLRNKGITGKEAEAALMAAGITTNKNAIPNDPQKPAITSGIRIGSPTLTTRGMKEAEMRIVAGLIADVLDSHGDEAHLKRVRAKVHALCKEFPLYRAR